MIKFDKEVLILKLSNTKEIYDFLKIYKSSSALNVALELGIFWKLSDKPLNTKEIAQIYNIPDHRCKALLDLMLKLGLLEKEKDMFIPSAITRRAIIEVYSADTWGFLAKEAQRHYPLMNNLTSNISHPDSLWKKLETEPSNWFNEMKTNTEYAKKFTYGLYEYHLSFAKKFARIFDMSGVNRMMDVGGGSGVMSLELLRRYSHLTATVIDIENVCIYGKEIAEKTLMINRINYEILDFLKDELPKGFELILQCDAGPFHDDFFKKLRISLTKNGRLVVVTNIDDDSAWLHYPNSKYSLYKAMNRFYSSLEVPSVKRELKTIENVKQALLKAGFQKVEHEIWDKGEVIIQAFNSEVPLVPSLMKP